MGVYIKSMEMPDGCYGCPVRTWCRAYKNNEWKMPKKLDDCPLVEIKEPHGRLIDAGFEEKHYASMTINPTPDVTPQDHMHSGYAAKAFQMAKTVIEAEGE